MVYIYLWQIELLQTRNGDVIHLYTDFMFFCLQFFIVFALISLSEISEFKKYLNKGLN
jgi:hypothetical protein